MPSKKEAIGSRRRRHSGEANTGIATFGDNGFHNCDEVGYFEHIESSMDDKNWRSKSRLVALMPQWRRRRSKASIVELHTYDYTYDCSSSAIITFNPSL